jgi:hydrogenase nickel incorporation protein HypA/HybF
MHEQSIALNIMDTASDIAQKQNARVVAVQLRLGPLAGVIKAALLSAWARVREGTELAGSRLEIVDVPLIIWCGACEADRSAASPQDLHCAQCGAPAKRVVSGRELEIMALEVED